MEIEREYGRADDAHSGESASTTPSTEKATEPYLTSEFPKLEEYEAARKYFAKTDYGATMRYKQPFSNQLKDEIISAFGVDGEIYRKANEVQKKVCIQYAALRVVTLGVFLATLLIQLSGLAGQPIEDAPISKTAYRFAENLQALVNGDLILLLIITAIGAFALRWGIRWAFLDKTIEIEAERLSHKIFTYIDSVSEDVTNCCSKARDRTGRGGIWPKRANAWVTIALWNAKRAEYLDRYATTIIWCVRTYTKAIERISQAVKVIATIVAISAVAFGAGPIGEYFGELSLNERISFGLLLGFQTFALWLFLPRKPADFWTLSFRKSATAHHEIEDNYPAKLGRVVENLVDEVLRKEFGGASSTGSSN